MQEQISKLIYYFMLYRRIDDTSPFSKLTHNNDLCPGIRLKVEDIIYKFNKYKNITYDIQGFKDEGTDILVRISDEENTKYICFQIKSNDDLKGKDYLSKIKSQTLDTQNSYSNNLLDYYILLCCDVTSENNSNSYTNKIRQIEAALNKVSNVHVIEPSYVLGFMNMSSLHIDVAIKNKLDDEDIIVKLAMEIVINLTPTERALIYFLISHLIYNDIIIAQFDDIYYNIFIEKVYKVSPNYDRKWFFIDDDSSYGKDCYRERLTDIKNRIYDDLEYLSNDFIEYKEYNKININLALVLPIATLMFDGSIRYEYNQAQTLDYIMNLLGGMKGLDNFEL